MSQLKRISVDLNEQTHFRSLVQFVPLLQRRHLQLCYDIGAKDFSMALDGTQIDELPIDKWTTYNRRNLESLVDKVLFMAFYCDYLDVSTLHPYAYGQINMNAKGKRLKVEINHKQKHEEYQFERENHRRPPVLDHRTFSLYSRLVTSQPLHLELFEDLYSILHCLEIEEITASKALHDDLVVVDLKHKSPLPQAQMEQHAQSLILNYLCHAVDLHAMQNITRNKDFAEDGQLSQIKVNLHISNVNQAYYAKISGFVLNSPGPTLNQSYLVDFV